MDQWKARRFWKTVADDGTRLRTVLDAAPAGHGFQEAIETVDEIVGTLRNAAAGIDPLLSVEVALVPASEDAVLQVAVTCNHDPAGIDLVQELVAVAPVLPPGIEACAFLQPVPEAMAHRLGSLDVLGRDIPIHKVLFIAQPCPVAPGTFDIVGFVPNCAVTGMDTEDVPGALAANIVLGMGMGMGIGELRVMTRLSSIGIAVTDHAPPDAVPAWDLVGIIDSARLQ